MKATYFKSLTILGISAGLAATSFAAEDGQKKRTAGGGASKGADRAAWFDKMDTNGDGKITQAEAGEERWERLGKLDKNGDGQVSLKDELTMNRSGGKGDAGGAGKGQLFARADKNGDKKLTQDELPAEAWERISKLDKNGDNAIDETEIAAVRDQVGGGGGAVRQSGDNSGKKPKRPDAES